MDKAIQWNNDRIAELESKAVKGLSVGELNNILLEIQNTTGYITLIRNF